MDFNIKKKIKKEIMASDILAEEVRNLKIILFLAR